MLGGVYILMAIMLVLGSLMSRREPFAELLTMALAWIAIFAGGFVLFTFRDDLGYVAQRLRAEATGEPVEQGREIRIPMAIDGHFWVDGRSTASAVKFLVDSGATMTTIGRETAARVGVPVSADTQPDRPHRERLHPRGDRTRAEPWRSGRSSASDLGCPHRGQRGSERPGHEFSVVAAALGGGRAAGWFWSPDPTDTLYIIYIIILMD